MKQYRVILLAVGCVGCLAPNNPNSYENYAARIELAPNGDFVVENSTASRIALLGNNVAIFTSSFQQFGKRQADGAITVTALENASWTLDYCSPRIVGDQLFLSNRTSAPSSKSLIEVYSMNDVSLGNHINTFNAYADVISSGVSYADANGALGLSMQPDTLWLFSPTGDVEQNFAIDGLGQASSMVRVSNGLIAAVSLDTLFVIDPTSGSSTMVALPPGDGELADDGDKETPPATGVIEYAPNQIFLVNNTQYLLSADVTSLSAAKLTSQQDLLYSAQGLSLDTTDTLLAVADGPAGVALVKVTSPLSAVYLNRAAEIGNAHSIVRDPMSNTFGAFINPSVSVFAIYQP